MLWQDNSNDFWPQIAVYSIPVAISLVAWLFHQWRSRVAQSWPTVEGIVESAQVRDEGVGRDRRAIPEVSYSYRIEGEYYGGYHQLNSPRDLELFRKGSRILVHFNRAHPSKSFLDRQELRSRKELSRAAGVR